MKPSRKRDRAECDGEWLDYARLRRRVLASRKASEQPQAATGGKIQRFIRRFADTDAAIATAYLGTCDLLPEGQQEHDMKHAQRTRDSCNELSSEHHSTSISSQRLTHDAMSMDLAFIKHTIESIVEETTGDSSYETKRSGVATLLYFATTISSYAEFGIHPACAFSHWKDFLEAAMISIASSMTFDQKERLHAESTEAATTTQKMENLYALARDIQMQLNGSEDECDERRPFRRVQRRHQGRRVRYRRRA